MSALMAIFLIAALGYWLGAIKVYGLQLGTSAVLLVALVFGHYSVAVPGIVRDIGLVCFVTAVGFIAGPVFFRNFKSQAIQYVLLGILIVLFGGILCAVSIIAFGIPEPLAVGILMGALTSTPGLAAAIESTGSNLASVGYGIAYPFGVVGVVLFVQMAPRLLGIDPAREGQRKDAALAGSAGEGSGKPYRMLDPLGFFSFSLAVTAGLLIASLRIPLPGGITFSFGNTGGPLLAGLVLGHFKHAGVFSLAVPAFTLKAIRELGLMLFLIGAGTDAGKGFIEILAKYGAALFLHGVFMTFLPMLCGFFIAYCVMKLDLLDSLGSICGGMTSTPALGALVSTSGTDSVAVSYAATYPIALICAILIPQFIVLLNLT